MKMLTIKIEQLAFKVQMLRKAWAQKFEGRK